MLITAVVAMSENRAIGKNNQLLWHLPADLQHFKKLTMGKPILMGRKTYQSIGRSLPGRLNVIITRNKNFKADSVLVFNSISDALDFLKDQSEICLIGGAELFREILPLVNRIYLTIVHQTFLGDAFFPELNLSEWNEIERMDHKADEKNQYPFSFVTLERKKFNVRSESLRS